MSSTLSMTAPNSQAVAAAPQPPRAARLGLAAIFFINGAAGASWMSRIPAIQSGLQLSEGQLGIALLGAALGALPMMTIAGWLSTRVGSRAVLIPAALLYTVASVGPTIAPSLPLLFLSILAWGAANGAMDVSMNAQAVRVEACYGRPIMSSFHGLFSVGAMVGAASGGLIASAGVKPAAHTLAIALLLAPCAALAGRQLLLTHDDTANQGPAFARPNRALLALGLIALFSFVGEGAMADWSAVYLRRTLGAGAGMAALGYASFSLAMAISRLSGDRLTHRFGPVALVRGGGLLASAGLTLALFAPTPAAALPGFALVGAGLSTVAPITFGAAARTRGVAPGPGIAAVTTTGYLGFLAGPPVIGGLAGMTSLRVALGIVTALALGVALLAGAVRRDAG